MSAYDSALNKMTTASGKNVRELSNKGPVFLVFLRHFGCVFCKEAMHDISELRGSVKEKGLELVFVHMSHPDIAEEYFESFKLSGVEHVSNPNKEYYHNFGVLKGTVSQLYGLSTWIRGFAAQNKGFKLELDDQLGDSTQMPGMFLLQDGKIVKHYIHRKASDRPEYVDFLDFK